MVEPRPDGGRPPLPPRSPHICDVTRARPARVAWPSPRPPWVHSQPLARARPLASAPEAAFGRTLQHGYGGVVSGGAPGLPHSGEAATLGRGRLARGSVRKRPCWRRTHLGSGRHCCAHRLTSRDGARPSTCRRRCLACRVEAQQRRRVRPRSGAARSTPANQPRRGHERTGSRREATRRNTPSHPADTSRKPTLSPSRGSCRARR